MVSGRKVVDWSQTGKANVPEGLLAEIRALPEVEAAAGAILDLAATRTSRRSSTRRGSRFPPSRRSGSASTRTNRGSTRSSSSADTGRGAARSSSTPARHRSYGFRLGDLVRVSSDGPAMAYPLVGIATFGEVDSIGTAAIAVFDVPDRPGPARQGGGTTRSRGGEGRRLGRPPRLAGWSRSRRRRPGAHRRRAGRGGRRRRRRVHHILRCFLLGFGGVSLFVGAFVIFNTLSITVAQRTRELATLRTLGASQAAGAALGRARRPRPRRLRLDHGTSRSASGSPRASTLCLRRSASTCLRPRPCSPSGRSSCRSCSARDHARRQRRPGDPRDPCAGHLGRARGRSGALRPAVASHDGGRGRHRLGGGRRRSCTGRWATGSSRPCGWLRSASACSLSSSGWRCSPRGSSGRSRRSSACRPPASAAWPDGWPGRTRFAIRPGPRRQLRR